MKLSELKDSEILIDENNCIYEVKEVKQDLQYFRCAEKKLWTTKEYQAHIDAEDMLHSAIESEADNMYEDWEDNVDIKKEHITALQSILDKILDSNKAYNTAYYQNEEVQVDLRRNYNEKE